MDTIYHIPYTTTYLTGKLKLPMYITVKLPILLKTTYVYNWKSTYITVKLPI